MSGVYSQKVMREAYELILFFEGVAALRQGRYFAGCDISTEAIEHAKIELGRCEGAVPAGATGLSM
jgi:hypothetical protein